MSSVEGQLSQLQQQQADLLRLIQTQSQQIQEQARQIQRLTRRRSSPSSAPPPRRVRIVAPPFSAVMRPVSSAFQPDEQVVPRLREQIRFFEEEHRIFADLNDFTQSHCLIQGPVQGGKSDVIIGLALYLLKVLGHSVIIVVRNFKCDRQQLKDKIETSDEFRGFQVTAETGATTGMFRNRTLTICLENRTQLSKIVRTYERTEDAHRYSLIIDEADAIGYKVGEPQNIEWLHKLQQHASHNIMVTATCFDVMYLERKLTNKRLYTVPLHRNYRGFEDVSFHTADHIDLRYREDRPISPSLMQWYENLSHLPPFRGMVREDAEGVDRSDHPVIALQVTEVLTDRQLDIMSTLATDERFRERFVILVWNGKGVHAYCSEELPPQLREHGAHAPIGVHKGVRMRIYKKATIREVLGMLRRYRQRYGSKTIVIIANKLAARSQNFVSSDYRWHLTHEIMQHADAKSISDIMQVFGRILGIFKYDFGVPLEIHCVQRDIDDMRQAFFLQNHVIQMSKQIANVSDEFRKMVHLLPRIPVYLEQDFNRCTTLKCPEPKWNVVRTREEAQYWEESDDEEEENYDDASEEENADATPMPLLADEIDEQKYLESFASNIERQIRQNLTNTVVRRVLRYMLDHPGGSSTQEEILQHCNISIANNNWRSITRWGGHAHYKLLEPSASESGRWVLNPAVVQTLRHKNLITRV